jgi:hypothetical protein
MGTSLTQCALDSSELLEASVKKITGCDPLILKIWKKAGSLETLMGAVSGLKQFHPDLLLVEANMLCYTPKEIPLDSRLLTAFHHLAKLRLNNVYMPEEKPTVGFQDVNLAVENFRAGIVDTTQLISFRNFAVQEQRSGTKILLVNIPLEGSEEFKKWKSADTALFNSNLNFIRKKLAFKYLESNMHLDRSYYLDKGHMNEKGFKTFSNWLCNELSRELMNL